MMNPVMVEATRGRHLESYHRGAAVVVDSLGHIIRRWGTIYEPVFGRSSLKFIQTLPLIESGAADAFHLTPEEIALACASHHAEEHHLKTLETWLQKLGKDERILECGIHCSIHNKTAKQLQNFYDKPSVLSNMCSGKHLGFLTTALHRNEKLEGYILREHPVQRRVEQCLSDLTGVDLKQTVPGIDGCGIPAFTIPLYNIALSQARFADPSQLHYPRQQAIKRILASIKGHPEMIAGSDGFDTKIIKLSQGQIFCKSGAGGVETGIIPSLGLGIALKIDDGNSKAAEIAFLAILHSLGILEEGFYEMLGPRFPIFSHSGKIVGFFHPTKFTTHLPETGRQ